MVRTKWHWTKWYTDKIVGPYGQNGMDKTVPITSSIIPSIPLPLTI